MNTRVFHRILFCCTALTAAPHVSAQTNLGESAIHHAAIQANSLEEIVVTAQKRSQNLQNVPISITAFTAKDIEAQRITNVLDLGTIAPNLTVSREPGGTGNAVMSMRGISANATVPGQDSEISLYVDGVYLGSSAGGAFDLPDIDRIEVLKGPQGTLFGRNATGGAISIITRDPPGKLGLRQDLTAGNYRQFKSRTRIDLPVWNNISATVNFVHDERRGDIKNLGAGTVWDYSAAGRGLETSPKYLGSKNSNSVFVAVKYQPSSDFTVTNKFDWSENHFTPEGFGLLGYNFATLSPDFAEAFDALAASQPNGNGAALTQIYPKRPKALNNSWTIPGYQRALGNSLVMSYRASDNVSFKNIAAYRETFVRASYQIDSLGGFVNTIPALGDVGSPFLVFSSTSQIKQHQFSDEFQFSYNSRLLSATAGFLYFQQKSRAGAPYGLPANYFNTVIPGGILPAAISYTDNKAISYAGYLQAEGHLTSKLDVIAGYRLSRDKKNGVYVTDPTGVSDENFALFPFRYNSTKPSYLIGVNYKPVRHILLYAKYSTAFVSGGSVGGIAFAPETASSVEAGIKAELLNNRLRANLAVWKARYHHLQQASAGAYVGAPRVGTVVVDQGDSRAKGFEFDVSALPVRGLTLSAGAGYTSAHFTRVNPIVGNLDTWSGDFLRPKWTSTISAAYESEPIFGDAAISVRLDADYRSSVNMNPFKSVNPAFDYVNVAPSRWILNGRIALQNVDLSGSTVEIALWARNLTNDKSRMYATFQPFVPPLTSLASSNYQSARTLGIDVSFTY